MATLQRSGQIGDKLYGMLEELPAGAYTCDAEGLITYYNRRAVDLWGREPKLNDPVDRFCGSFKLFSTDGTPIPHDQCWMALALRDGKEYNGQEIVIERPNGTRWIALAHANPLYDEMGDLSGAVNVLIDITDRKRLEEALREADRRKSEFLAMLAHELRNPLNPIRNAVKVLRLDEVDGRDVGWCADMIDRQVDHLTRLIDDLLDISRITRNRLELRKQTVKLSDVVKGAVETCRPLINQNKQKLTVDLPPEPIFLKADVVRLSQVIINLLNNASKFTEAGGHIRLIATREGNDVVVSVVDSGIGISAERLPHLFEMFYQVDCSKERSQGGLGIGLTLVQRLVEMHGGSVTARSEGAGKGSEFVVRLPVLGGSAPSSAASSSNRNGKSNNAHRILIVDDNRDAAKSLGMLLKITGNETCLAHDGIEAVELAETFRPDVVLLDISLPRLSGHEAGRRIRQQPWGKDTVLVAVTGWAQEEDRRRSFDAGFNHHMVKPLDYNALMSWLGELKSGPA